MMRSRIKSPAMMLIAASAIILFSGSMDIAFAADAEIDGGQVLYGIDDYDEDLEDSQVQPLGPVHLPQTGQTTSYAPGDDGDLQMGIVWPIPRFAGGGNGVTIDHLTGLMWTKDANLPGESKTWQEALDYVKGMNAGTHPNFGYTDWRLPNINELESFSNPGETDVAAWLKTHGFINVQSGFYWSSTTFAGLANSAWLFFMYPGSLGTLGKTAELSVWPVRGTTTNPAQVWQTGQTKCYDTSGSEIVCTNTGQDGELQAGTEWPIQRFQVVGECVTDNLTGLVWTKDGNLAGSSKTWQEALNYVASVNNGGGLCGFTDWRIPNIKELRTLFDYSEYNRSLPSDHPFINVQTGFYWSSTTGAVLMDTAWLVFMLDGANGTLGKNAALSIWPVRSGHQEPGTPEITLQSPSNGAVFNLCSLINKYHPSFQWETSETLAKGALLFSTSSTDFTAPIAKANIKGTQRSWTPSASIWKKITTSSYNGGNIQDTYWKVIGTIPDKTAIESDVSGFRIGPSQMVTIQSPLDQTVLPSGTSPTIEFDCNCNVKFRLEFSSMNDFSDPTKIKGYNYSSKDPNTETTLHKTLSSSQWTSVKKLVGTGPAYFRIKAWDGLNRETLSEVRSFTTQ